MLVTNRRASGGRPLKSKHYPLGQDSQGNYGFKIGYIEDEPIIMRICDANDIALEFGYSVKRFNWFSKWF